MDERGFSRTPLFASRSLEDLKRFPNPLHGMRFPAGLSGFAKMKQAVGSKTCYCTAAQR
jgi:hypothetical protein